MTNDTAVPTADAMGVRDGDRPHALRSPLRARTATAGLAARLDFTLMRSRTCASVWMRCAMLLTQALPVQIDHGGELTGDGMRISVSVLTSDGLPARDTPRGPYSRRWPVTWTLSSVLMTEYRSSCTSAATRWSRCE